MPPMKQKRIVVTTKKLDPSIYPYFCQAILRNRIKEEEQRILIEEERRKRFKNKVYNS